MSLIKRIEKLEALLGALFHYVGADIEEFDDTKVPNIFDDDELDDDDSDEPDKDGQTNFHVIQAIDRRVGFKSKKEKKTPHTLYYRDQPIKMKGWQGYWTKKISEARQYATFDGAESTMDEMEPPIKGYKLEVCGVVHEEDEE